MIRIKPNILNVRDPETGKFESVAAIKGADGVIENLGAFATNETGDSENLLMTQKGVTDIRNELKDELDGVKDTYLTKTSASSTYLTKTSANNTYLSKTDANNTYLKKSEASSGGGDSQALNTLINQLVDGDLVVGKAATANSLSTKPQIIFDAYNKMKIKIGDQTSDGVLVEHAIWADAADVAVEANRAMLAKHLEGFSSANTVSTSNEQCTLSLTKGYTYLFSAVIQTGEALTCILTVSKVATVSQSTISVSDDANYWFTYDSNSSILTVKTNQSPKTDVIDLSLSYYCICQN